jgi:hypothetical protein
VAELVAALSRLAGQLAELERAVADSLPLQDGRALWLRTATPLLPLLPFPSGEEPLGLLSPPPLRAEDAQSPPVEFGVLLEELRLFLCPPSFSLLPDQVAFLSSHLREFFSPRVMSVRALTTVTVSCFI